MGFVGPPGTSLDGGGGRGMQKIASVGLLFGVLTFAPSGARCEVYYPIPIETISGTAVDQSQNLVSHTTGFLDVVQMLAQTRRIKRDRKCNVRNLCYASRSK